MSTTRTKKTAAKKTAARTAPPPAAAPAQIRSRGLPMVVTYAKATYSWVDTVAKGGGKGLSAHAVLVSVDGAVSTAPVAEVVVL